MVKHEKQVSSNRALSVSGTYYIRLGKYEVFGLSYIRKVRFGHKVWMGYVIMIQRR